MSSNIPSPGNNLWDNGANFAPDYAQPNSSDAANDADMQADYDQWYTDEQLEQQDEASLASAIANLVNVSHEHNYNATFEAMMMFFTQVFPDVLNIQQDNLNTLSDTQNMSSDLRNFVTSIENDENTLTSQTTDNPLFTPSKDGNGNVTGWTNPNYTQAEQSTSLDLYGNTNDLYAWSYFLSSNQSVQNLNISGVTCALDPTDGLNLQNNALNIAQQIDPNVVENNGNILSSSTGLWFEDTAQNPSAPSNVPLPDPSQLNAGTSIGADGANIAYTIWLSNQNIQYNSVATPPPSGGITNGSEIWTDNNPIKTMQQDLQQANSGTSSLSTTTQTTEQFYTNQYNQLTGIDNSMQQNFAEEISAIIQNQASN